MATIYADGVDNNYTIAPANPSLPNGQSLSDTRGAVIAIETELGVNPKGIYADVRVRLDAIEASLVLLEEGSGGGGEGVIVIGSPTQGQGIVWDGSEWIPSSNFFNQPISTTGSFISGSATTTSLQTGSINSSGTITLTNIPAPSLSSSGQGVIYFDQTDSVFKVSQNGGAYVNLISNDGITFSQDLSGDSNTQTVIGLQGHPLANTIPAQSYVPVYDTSASQYDIRQLSFDDILPAFSINSFSGSQTVEIGATIINPSFTMSYSSPPTSGNITNTDGTNSPHALSSPFTSATITGTFHKTISSSVSFTLTVVAATTKTANASLNFYPRSFVGVGTAGATGATASSLNASLVGATGTLNNSGIANSVVGTTTASVSPSGQKIYYLTPHTSSAHSYKDGSGFQFAFNAPTTFSFTNVNGSILSYDLYESTNILSSPFALTIVS